MLYNFYLERKYGTTYKSLIISIDCIKPSDAHVCVNGLESKAYEVVYLSKWTGYPRKIITSAKHLRR